MKIGIKNLDPIKDANLEIGDLTIICGKNNMGKTYLSYTLFSLIDTITSNVKLKISSEILDKFTDMGKIEIKLSSLLDLYKKTLNDTLLAFTRTLPFFLAKDPASLKDVFCTCSFEQNEYEENLRDGCLQNIPFPITENCDILVNKNESCDLAHFILSNNADKLPDKEVIQQRLCSCISQLMNSIFPDIFIITCERTGASLFRNELIISREMGKEAKSKRYTTKVTKLREKQEFRGYPYPIRKDIEFAIHYYDESLHDSFLTDSREGKDILEFFNKIVGGQISVKKDNIVKFSPQGSNVELRLIESSSTIRSLSEFYFYLRHKAKPGQILMMDEPELSLHPENQRKLARIFARLINAGIKVFITTHSDYIIKELNTLLMLNYSDDPRMPDLQKKYGYTSSELLKAEQLRVYCAGDNTITPVEVSQDVGIGISSFDENIREMGKMQRDILYGGRKNA